MSLITDNFPDMVLFDYPVDRWDLFTYKMNCSLDSLPNDENKLLEMISKEFLRKKDYWDKEYKDEKRALKLLRSHPKSMELIRGTGMMSMFVYTFSKKGTKISSTIEDNIEVKEYMDAPGNADYNQDYIDSPGYVYLDEKRYDLVTEGVPCNCVFAVEHKDRDSEPTIQCNHCHGSGVVKCPSCQGSGRESYEDSNFASGDVKIKTGKCSECGGSGRVYCEDCYGKGFIEIFAPHYSLVRSVQETISKRVEVWTNLPNEDLHNPIYSPVELGKKTFARTVHGDIERSYLNQAHDVLDLVQKNGQIAYWKKNNKIYLKDNRSVILEVMRDRGLDALYRKMINNVEGHMNEVTKHRGDVISRKEAHFYYPVIVLKVNYGDNNCSKFILYEQKGQVSVNLVDLIGITSGEALKAKILAFYAKHNR